MKMTTIAFLCLTILLCLGPQESLAQGPDLAALDINAIKEIQLMENDNEFSSQVKILLQNSSDKAIKIRNGKFKITFKEQESVIPFGEAPINELVIPPTINQESGPGQTEAILNVKIGPKNDNTIGILIQLFNIVGNPSNSIVMIMDGGGEIGHKVEKGWIYQTGMRAELEFIPTIQREILFK